MRVRLNVIRLSGYSSIRTAAASLLRVSYCYGKSFVFLLDIYERTWANRVFCIVALGRQKPLLGLLAKNQA